MLKTTSRCVLLLQIRGQFSLFKYSLYHSALFSLKNKAFCVVVFPPHCTHILKKMQWVHFEWVSPPPDSVESPPGRQSTGCSQNNVPQANMDFINDVINWFVCQINNTKGDWCDRRLVKGLSLPCRIILSDSAECQSLQNTNNTNFTAQLITHTADISVVCNVQKNQGLTSFAFKPYFEFNKWIFY